MRWKCARTSRLKHRRNKLDARAFALPTTSRKSERGAAVQLTVDDRGVDAVPPICVLFGSILASAPTCAIAAASGGGGAPANDQQTPADAEVPPVVESEGFVETVLWLLFVIGVGLSTTMFVRWAYQDGAVRRQERFMLMHEEVMRQAREQGISGELFRDLVNVQQEDAGSGGVAAGSGGDDRSARP